MAEALLKRESMLDILSQLSSLTEPARTIPRRRAVTPQDLLREYYATNRPLVIDGLMDEWPARQRWTPAYLASVCGDVMVDVMDGRDGESAREQYVNGRGHAMRFGSYVD